MNLLKFVVALFVASILSVSATTQVRGDAFGSGPNRFDIDFVTVGKPGNPADTTGTPDVAGSVSYEYRIGKYEISRDMIDKVNAVGALNITLQDMSAYGGNGPNKPALVLAG